jgi:hypothetical protein
MRTVKGHCLLKMELVSSARYSSSFEALSIRFFKLQEKNNNNVSTNKHLSSIYDIYIYHIKTTFQIIIIIKHILKHYYQTYSS